MYLRTAIFQSHQYRMYSIYIYTYIYISYIVIHQEYYGIIIIVKQHVRFFRRFVHPKRKSKIENRPGHSNLIADERESNRSTSRWSRSEGAHGAASEKSMLETTGPPALVLLDLWEGRVDWIDSFVDIKAMIHTFWVGRYLSTIDAWNIHQRIESESMFI